VDRDALETLVLTHQAQIYRYVRYLGAPRDAAEDLVQETFLAALRSKVPADVEEDVRQAAWLRGIARNMFLRFCRRRRRGPTTIDSSFLEQAEASWESGLLRGSNGFDYVEALRRCLDMLADRQRKILNMRYAERRSRSEMARLANMTENGIKSLLRRIRARLAECVERGLQLERAG
jgi:RNA polymerase sigma-70 factor (ECF subfamily)